MIKNLILSFARILVIFSFLIYPCKSFSDIIPDNPSESYPINEIKYLKDPDGVLSIQDILRDSTRFEEMEPGASFGITQSVFWLKFELSNKSPRSNWFLELGTPYYYEADLYFIDGDSIHKIFSGTGQKFTERHVKTNQLIFPLKISQNTLGIYYLRLKTRYFMRPVLKVATMKALYEVNQTQDILNGIYFGLLFAMMAYNLFVFISIRDKTYLYYVLYTLFLSLHVAALKGYTVEFLWSSETLLKSSHIWISLGIFFAILFSNSFLHTRKYVPKLYKFQWIVYLTVVLSLALSFLGYEAAGFHLLAFNPSYVYYVFIMGIAVYRKGFMPARYYFFGFGILVTGIMFMEFVEYAILPSNLFTEHFLQIGSAIEAIVLSYALAAKLNFYKKEKEEAQIKALQQSKDFSHKLIQSQESERKRIAAELHDSIGQSLILIKNKILLLKQSEKSSDNKLVPVNDLTDMVSDTIQEVRTISYGLRPFQLDLLGLTKSIHELVEETEEGSGIDFKAEIDDINGIFSKDDEINIYRIIQECLNNIVKHSGAKEAGVYIRRKDSAVEIYIEDYGKGFNYSDEEKDHTHGFGLLGIQERLNILKGTITREKSVPSGTTIIIVLPMPIGYEKP